VEDMSKQDRQGVRTPAELERKYDFSLLSGQSNMTSDLKNQINQLNQSLSMFAASTNVSIEQLSGDIDDLEQAVAELIHGGGGGSGQSSLLIVNVEADSLDTESLSADKTFSEIEDAIQAGFDVKVKLISNVSYNIYLQMTAHLPGSEIDFCGYYNGVPLVLQIFADK
jgi:hypothetical protein